MRDFWTAERISVLQELWAGGATAEAIAVEIGGVSRSAVLGKIYRLRHAGKPTAAPEIRATARRTKQRVPRLKPPCVEPKGLLDLTNDSCRWIVEAAIKWAVTATLSHFQ
jgi:GcrA cell cycle regulator